MPGDLRQTDGSNYSIFANMEFPAFSEPLMADLASITDSIGLIIYAYYPIFN